MIETFLSPTEPFNEKVMGKKNEELSTLRSAANYAPQGSRGARQGARARMRSS